MQPRDVRQPQDMQPAASANARCPLARTAESKAVQRNAAETREIECERCSGTGIMEFGHPNDPSPRSCRCDQCDGTGWETVRVYAIEEEDTL